MFLQSADLFPKAILPVSQDRSFILPILVGVSSIWLDEKVLGKRFEIKYAMEK